MPMRCGAQQRELKKKHTTSFYLVKPATKARKAGPMCSLSAHSLNLFSWAGPLQESRRLRCTLWQVEAPTGMLSGHPKLIVSGAMLKL